MSGIAGVVNFDGTPVDPAVLDAVAQAGAHRGPDGIGRWFSHYVGLVHLALRSTPQSSREHQPLVSQDGRLVLVADARIDNRSELVAALRGEDNLYGRSFSDSDLILAAYSRWGESCASRLLGDFAFAVWDARSRKLFCARDALGVRRLHYSVTPGGICFASEAHQIVQHPQVDRRLDEVAVADFLVNHCQDETRTYYAEVQCLPPAHCLVADHGGVRVVRYWDFDSDKRVVYADDRDYAMHLRTLLDGAVADRLRGAGPVAAVAMSGGLDSCSVAAIAHAQATRGGGATRVRALSHSFDTLTSCDERAYSGSMTAELGLEVEYLQTEHFPLFGDPDVFVPGPETPFVSWESAEREIMHRSADNGARVLLTGHGGDTMIAGSSRVFADRIARGELAALRDLRTYAHGREGLLWEFAHRCVVRPLIPDRLVEGIRRGLGLRWTPWIPSWIAPDFVRGTGLADRLRSPRSPRRYSERARQAVYEGIANLGSVSRAVYWYERTAASYGLEVRHPFLDRRLAEFVLAIPSEQLIGEGYSKWLLRRAMQGVLPEAIRLRAGKTSFRPYLEWSLRTNAAKARFAELLQSPLSATLNVIDRNELRRALTAFIAGESPENVGALWFAFSLEAWLRGRREHGHTGLGAAHRNARFAA
jgi:asparagine synthase (glutamine-hydrolysing)